MRVAGVGVLGLTTLLVANARAPHLDPFTGMPFVRIDAGTFVMGTPSGESQREAQEVQHRVSIGKPFYLAIHEVTQAEWTKVMGTNPSHFQSCGGRCPVENVSYRDIMAFIRMLDDRSSWKGFRLPTEAEWEYACRAGGAEAFGASSTLSTDEANYDGRYPYAGGPKGQYRSSTTPVGSFAPNRWGLFDMSGNVWEWTADDHCSYPSGTADDPVGSCGAPVKVIRGGSWFFGADSARCGLRYTHRPQDRGFSLGVRLAHDAK